MADETEPTEEPTEVETEPAISSTPVLVIGSNIGHARRHAERRGLPKRAAIAIGQQVPGGIPTADGGGTAWADIAGQTVLLAKPDGDNAEGWDELRAELEEAGIATEVDTTN